MIQLGEGRLGVVQGLPGKIKLFDEQGRYQERLSLACEGEARNDRLFPLGDGRFVLVMEYYSALDALRGRTTVTEESAREAESLQVICYRAGS
ncbi:MAG: hypothetical protein ABIF77_15425 [bacterium]